MCSIIGYKGKCNSTEILLNGLRRLEYRGYDSVGMSILSNEKIITKKDIGKVDEVNTKLNFTELQGNAGIAHTRWATHGGVTANNSHPHLSSDEKISVVHNGIIENYFEIKKQLENKGLKFLSQTDTEVIPKLIEYFIQIGEDFETAFVKMLKEIKGTYAILALNNEGKFCFARECSPLIIGIGKEEIFFASDALAFLDKTKRIIYLDDGDFGFYDKELLIMNKSGVKDYKIEESNCTLEQINKENYPHFMLKEINEQSETIINALNQNKELIESVRLLINNSKNIFLLGCGTSYHACLAGRYYFASKGINTTTILASEFKSWKNFFKDSIILALSQSGETADLLEAVKTAKENGAKIISIVNVISSTLARLSNIVIPMNSGPEICVLSTKSFTAQLNILKLICGLNTTINSNDILAAIQNNESLAKEIAKEFSKTKDMFVIGREECYPIALEGALKIKEVTYIHAEGFAGGELKHGTISLIEEGIPAIVLVSDNNKERILSNAIEIKSRGGKIIAIGCEDKKEIFDYFFQIDKNNFDLLSIIPIQLIAYYLALEKGCDPDKPRNLAKSVTVH